MATTVAPKPVSAVDRLLAEEGSQGFQLTDEIVVPHPSRAQAEKLANADGEEAIMRILFGEHYEAVNELVETLPMKVSVKLLQELTDFLTEGLPDIQELLAGLEKRNETAEKITQALTKKG